MSKEKNYWNGGCITCEFAQRDERGRFLGSCLGYANCSYMEYTGETDITEEEKDEKIVQLQQQLKEKDEEIEKSDKRIMEIEDENEKLHDQVNDEQLAQNSLNRQIRKLEEQLQINTKQVCEKIRDDFINSNNKVWHLHLSNAQGEPFENDEVKEEAYTEILNDLRKFLDQVEKGEA